MNACRTQSTAGRRRRGFTLVELLVVILIIGLLVALVSMAAMRALTTGKNAVIKAEIEELNRAVVAYSNENGGEFPPSFASYDTTASVAHQARIVRHLQRRFPRYANASSYAAFRQDVLDNSVTCGFAANALDVNNLDQAEALVFWLGGYPSTLVERRLLGFSKDPAYPMVGFRPDTNVGQPQRTVPFGFDSFRLVDRDGDNWLEYVPKGVSPTGDMPPYVYFDSLSYTSYTATPQLLMASYPSTTTGALRGPAANINIWGRCWPMWRVAPASGVVAQWQNSDTFQIISAGLDGAYATNPGNSSNGPTIFPQVPTDASGALDYGPMQDNITNFAAEILSAERERLQ